MYKGIKDVKDVENLLRKKEFLQFKLPKQNIGEGPLEELIRKEGNIVLHSHQLFLRNFINPNTPYNRMLIKHMTGTGKTIASLAIAQNFIEVYKKMYSESTAEEPETPMCFIIGFSKHVFQKELLRHPEFGFVTKQDIADYKRLKQLAETGTESDSKVLAEFELRIRKRISNKKLGGFYKFYGYKEFYNRLLLFSQAWADAHSGVDQTKVDFAVIREGIADKTITINFSLIKSLCNSIVICDEIHNTYNSLEMNNYGTVLGIVLDIFDLRDASPYEIPPDILPLLVKSNMRMILMSATPINNNPTECIDLINLLVHRSQVVTREDLFDVDADGVNILRKDAADKIKKLLIGKISYLSDNNPKYYPTVIWEGTSIPGIPYLKFIRCPMSPLHQATYNSIDSIPPDGQTLIDLVVIGPKGPDEPDEPKGRLGGRLGIGLFRTKDIKYGIGNASQNWKDKHGINIVKQVLTGTKSEVSMLTGDFMKLGNIGKYSAKYHRVLVDLIENTKKNMGKVMIVHQYVKIAGILFIQEMLKLNGFIDEFSGPTDSTLCVVCGQKLKEHKSQHDFLPARYISAHGDVDKSMMDKSIEKYNSPDNSFGHKYKVLIGSKMIKESYDFKDVQHEWVVHPAANISTLIQIFGRSSRKNSHANLPPQYQRVFRRIYVSSLAPSGPKKLKKGPMLSYEEERYFEKMRDYVVIQDISEIFNSIAVDALINRDIIFPAGKSVVSSLEDRYFVPGLGFKLTNKPELQSFDIYHRDEEINYITYIIKRLFVEVSRVYTYSDLWKDVQAPPFKLQYNSELFNEDNYKLALHNLLYSDSTIDIADDNVVDNIFNPNSVITLPGQIMCRVIYINKLYILAPMNRKKEAEGRLGNVKRIGDISYDVVGFPDVYEDCWIRDYMRIEPSEYNITKYLKTSNVSYENMKYNFYKKYKNVDIVAMPTTSELYGLDFHIRLIEESIRYAFNVLVNTDIKFSELHEFYFKMLYYYTRLDLILFANNLEELNMDNYKDYITDKPIKVGKEKIAPENRYNAFLMSSIIRSTGSEEQFNIHRLNDFIKKSRSSPGTVELVKQSQMSNLGITRELSKTKKSKITTKVLATMLPVGHFLTVSDNTNLGFKSVPKLYNPIDDTWNMSPEFTQKSSTPVKENNIIIGYYEKNPTGIDIKFKLRSPIQNIVKHADTRMTERGASCANRPKEELLQIAKKLGIKLENDTIGHICTSIKLDLMNREMQERRKHQHLKKKGASSQPQQIKWFYLHFE
mgnify:CR=1 FL=1